MNSKKKTTRHPPSDL